jgi:hypothetical protein
MTIKEKLYAEIENLDENAVDAVYQFVRQFSESRSPQKSGGLLSKLMEIKIDGPVDFSENLDEYLYGGKSVEDNIH